jgi:hypothetical protein
MQERYKQSVGFNLRHWRLLFVSFLILLRLFFHVFPFLLNKANFPRDFFMNRQCANNSSVRLPFFQLGREMDRSIEMLRETEMVREMHMKIGGDGDS